MPIYDIAQGGSVTLEATRGAGVLATLAGATVYSVPGTTTVSWVDSITLINTDSVTRTASLYIVDAAASADLSHLIYSRPVLPYYPVEIVGPWFIGTNGYVFCTASANSVVAVTADVMEFGTHPAGLLLPGNGPSTLTTSAVTAYTVPSSGVEHAVHLSTTIYNSDSVARRVVVYRSTSASPGVKDVIFGRDMPSLSTSVFPSRPKVLNPGDKLIGLASANSVVSIRHTVMEVS